MTLPIETLDYADLTPRQVTGLLAPYDRARLAAKRAKEEQDGIAEAIKGYLLSHPDEVVSDLEHDLEARLQIRSTGDTYAVALMPTELLSALAGLGAIKVDTKVLDALKNSVAAAAQAIQYKRPGGTTAALVVRLTR